MELFFSWDHGRFAIHCRDIAGPSTPNGYRNPTSCDLISSRFRQQHIAVPASLLVDTPGVGQKSGHLLRILGVSFGIAVGVGTCIGGGILRTPGVVAASLGTPRFRRYWAGYPGRINSLRHLSEIRRGAEYRSNADSRLGRLMRILRHSPRPRPRKPPPARQPSSRTSSSAPVAHLLERHLPVHLLRALALLVRHRSAGGCRSRRFAVGEIEHGRDFCARARRRPCSSHARHLLYENLRP
jgi:hypothetical protein